MLFKHSSRRADARALWTAGVIKATSTAMIEITTSSSMSVKPRRVAGRFLPRKNRVACISASPKSAGGKFGLLPDGDDSALPHRVARFVRRNPVNSVPPVFIMMGWFSFLQYSFFFRTKK
jgi:hypothetical protein